MYITCHNTAAAHYFVNRMPPKRKAAAKAVGRPAKKKAPEASLTEIVRQEIRLALKDFHPTGQLPQDVPLPPVLHASQPDDSQGENATAHVMPSTSATVPAQDAMMSAVLSDFLAGNLQGESTVPQPLPDLPQSPLGIHVQDRLKSKIIGNQYVEFFELLPNITSQIPEISIAISGSVASVSSSRGHKKVNSIEQWTDAWFVYAALYLERHPLEAVGLLRYAETIRDMARRGPHLAWRQYDEQFRLTKASQPIPWGVPLGYLYLRCMTQRPQIAPSQPFRSGTQWQRPTFNAMQGQTGQKDSRHPVGFCWAFQDGRSCDRAVCPHKHQCTACNGTHPRSKCNLPDKGPAKRTTTQQQRPNKFGTRQSHASNIPN